jgi:hypothetical protein
VTPRLSVASLLLYLGSAVAARAQQPEDEAGRIRRDEGPAARWAHDGFAGDGPWDSFSGAEAIVGSTLLYWNHGMMEGLDLETGQVRWMVSRLGHRECGYPDVAVAGPWLVAPALEGDDAIDRAVLQVVDTRTGAISGTIGLGSASRVNAVSCAPCIVETGDVAGVPTLHAVDLESRKVVATLPGWSHASEVADGTILARRGPDADAPCPCEVDLLNVRTLGSLWSAEVGRFDAAWRSGPWWVLALRGDGWEIERLVRLWAPDGQVDPGSRSGELVAARTSCKRDADGHVHCLERRGQEGDRRAIARLSGESGTQIWSTRMPVGETPGWWHVFENTLLVELRDDDFEHSLLVMDWDSGRVRSRVHGLGQGGQLWGFGSTVILQRRDASLVAYDVNRLAKLRPSP